MSVRWFVALVALVLVASTASGQLALNEVYNSQASPDKNDVGWIGVASNGSHIATFSRGWWGSGNTSVGRYGEEVAGGEPATWTMELMVPYYNDGIMWQDLYRAPGWKVAIDSSGYPLAAATSRTTGDTTCRVVWKTGPDPADYAYSDVTLPRGTERSNNEVAFLFDVLPNGNIGVCYKDDSGTGWYYSELTDTGGGAWAIAAGTSERQLSTVNRLDGVDSLIDPVNNRVRFFMPGDSMAAITGPNSVQVFPLSDVVTSTSAIRSALRANAGSDGRYYLTGHSNTANGVLTLVEFEYDESSNTALSSNEYVIAGDGTSSHAITNGEAVYDPKTGAVVVAYLDGQNNGDDTAGQVGLYVRIGERDGGGMLVFGDPILIDAEAARRQDSEGGDRQCPLDIDIVPSAGDSILYFAYGRIASDSTNQISDEIRVAKYLLTRGGGIPGDTDNDGDVDLDDLFAVRNNFGTSSGATLADGDTDGDGDVDLDDLFAVRNNFGTGLMVIPEPTAVCLMVIGSVALLRRRQR